MNKKRVLKLLFFGFAIGLVVHYANSLLSAQIERKARLPLSNNQSARRHRGLHPAPKDHRFVVPASFQSDASSNENQSSVPATVDKTITNNAREMSGSSAMNMPANKQENIGQTDDDTSLPTVQFRDGYDQHYRAIRPLGGRRFSTDVGSNLSGVYSSPSPPMAASEMVVNQTAKIEMLERIIASYQTENGLLKQELTLSIQALTETNLAFKELQTQMLSVNQQNQTLKIKFKELAETYARSETEIQQMLSQLRQYVSKELNAANLSSTSRSMNRLVQPGALPNSELLPSPKN